MNPISSAARTASLLLLAAAISTAQTRDATPKRDYWPTREWKIDRPENRGIEPSTLEAFQKEISEDLIYSALIVKNGYIVFEYYKGKLDRDSRYLLYSCTKSVTSALVGIAIDKGLIKGVDQRVSAFLPGLDRPDVDERKKRLTIRHLLTMTAGFAWSDDAHYRAMIECDDWVEYVLARPLAHEPGKRFNYSTGVSHLLSAIVQKATGQDTLAFARENLFGPIGIRSAEWQADPRGVRVGGNRLELTARDAARFGFLYLNRGRWAGKQVISETWVRDSTQRQSAGYFNWGGYGYQWWTRSRVRPVPFKFFYASGYGGQHIVVVPKLDLVAVVTGFVPPPFRSRAMQLLEHEVIRPMLADR